MFTVPNTSIVFNTYDEDANRVPAAQTFINNAENVGGYLYASLQPVYVRLTVGTQGAVRKLPEFFMAPGVQDLGSAPGVGGSPVTKIEVRTAGVGSAQFWAVLTTALDPIGSFSPSPYQVGANGQIIPPPAQNLIFQHNGLLVATEGTADFIDANGMVWTLTDDPVNGRVLISVAPPATSGVLSYVQFTAPVNIATTTEATATTIVTAGAVNFDGVSEYILEYFFSSYRNTTGNACEIISLFHDDTAGAGIGQFMDANFPATLHYEQGGGIAQRRLIPPAGNRTYSVRAFVA